MRAWERQSAESAKAFEAFALYRDLGSGRSLAKVGQMLGKSTALMERWSVKHEWVPRVQALEARDQMIARSAVEEHLAAQAQDHGRREAALREKALAAREEAMEQAQKMLSWPLTEQRVIHEETEDGETVVYEFKPAGWNKSTAINLYRMAMADAPAEIPEQEQELDLSDMSEAELQELIRLESKVRFKPPE